MKLESIIMNMALTQCRRRHRTTIWIDQAGLTRLGFVQLEPRCVYKYGWRTAAATATAATAAATTADIFKLIQYKDA